MVLPERNTRGIRRPTPGAPQQRNQPSPPQNDPAPAVTQEQVSISLIDIIEELANHVHPAQRPHVELLRRLAREKPDQHAKVKENMMTVAGPDAVRAAISALLSSQSKMPPPKAPPKPSPPPPPPLAWSAAGAEVPMPPNLPAIFGSVASTPHELQEFKAELVNAFHCRAPADERQAALSTKLQRLRQHVTQCPDAGNGCLLCSIFSYLRSFHPPSSLDDDTTDARRSSSCHSCSAASGGAGGAAGGSGSLIYADELLSSKQLLPCWDRERSRISWLPPPDALAQLRTLTATEGGANAPSSSPVVENGALGHAVSSVGGASNKRVRTSSGGSLALSALGAYPALHQGVLTAAQQQWSMPAYADMGGASVMPRVPTAGAPAPSAHSSSSYAAPAPAEQIPLPMPESLDLMHMTSEMYMGGGVNGADHGLSGMRPRGRGSKRGPNGLELAMPRGSSAASMLPPGISLDATRGGLNVSGNLSSINLGEMLRSTSMSDLGFGGSFSDLGALGLSFSKAASELREAASSELSLSGLLNDSAGDIVAGLGASHYHHGGPPNGVALGGGASTTASTTNPGSTPSSPGSFRLPNRHSEQLLDIISDFGASPQQSPRQSISTLVA